jgi:hypothetical protein
VDTTLSPRIKLFALVGGLGAAALAGGMFFLSRPAAVDTTPIPAPAVQRAAVPAKPRPQAKPKAPAVVSENGVPLAIVRQLATHRVVVVSVYADGAGVDTLARAEARAGARDAHAGFAALDVSDRRLALALAEGTKQLAAPQVVVFERSGIANRYEGFADRTLVAQLASSVR